MSQKSQSEATCSKCGKTYRGVIFSPPDPLSLRIEKDRRILGFRCQNCGADFCVECKNKYLEISLWSGWDKTECPVCGGLFGPSELVEEASSAARRNKPQGPITKVFEPTVSDNEIKLALSSETAERAERIVEERRKSRKRKLILMAVGIVIGLLFTGLGYLLRDHSMGQVAFAGGILIIMAALFFVTYGARTSQEDPKAVMESFLNELLGKTHPDYARVLRWVAPLTSESISVDMVSEAYEEVKRDILSTVRFRETAKCSECDMERKGLWSVKKWTLRSYACYTRCGKCYTEYCKNCFLKKIPIEGTLIRQRYCPNCEGKLEIPYEGHIFILDPEVSQTPEIEEISVSYDEMNDRLAHLHAKVRVESRLKRLVQAPSTTITSTIKYSELGDRGRVICHFYNTAVRIRDKWYLLSALPNGYA